MKLREHRGGLAESMETVAEIEPTTDALVRKILSSVGHLTRPNGILVGADTVHVKPYCFDTAVIDAFERFGDFLLGLGMDCGGGLGDPWELWIHGIHQVRWKSSRQQQWARHHCTEADRVLVEEFLSRMPEVDRFEVGPLGTGEEWG